MTVTGRVSLTGVDAGTYIITNMISGGTNGVQNLVVTLTVISGPRIELVGIDGQPYGTDVPASPSIGTDFGTVATNDSASVTLSLTNAGQTALTVFGYELTGNGFTVSNLPSTVTAGTAVSFTLHCAPTSLGAQSAVLTLTNSSAHPLFMIHAAVSGIKPGEIGINRASVGFVTTYGSNPEAESYLLTNKGVAAFVYTNTVTYGAGASDWLSHGSQKNPTYQTDPSDLTVALTFNSSSTAPTDPGTYAVTGTVQDANYTGSGPH